MCAVQYSRAGQSSAELISTEGTEGTPVRGAQGEEQMIGKVIEHSGVGQSSAEQYSAVQLGATDQPSAGKELQAFCVCVTIYMQYILTYLPIVQSLSMVPGQIPGSNW